jgi:hypothetical protein
MCRLTWLWRAPFFAVAVAVPVVDVNAETSGSVNVYVKEDAGIRRTAYPVGVRVPFPKGSLTDPGRVRTATVSKSDGCDSTRAAHPWLLP